MERLRVSNWERYQSADIVKKSHGRPPWVKLHRDFFLDYGVRRLGPDVRYLALFLVSFASEFLNEFEEPGGFPNDTEEISSRSALTTSSVTAGVKVLLSSGFLSRLSREDHPPGGSLSNARVRSPSTSISDLALDAEEKEIVVAWLEHAPPLRKHTADYFTDSKVQRKLHHALRLYGRTELVEAIGRYAKIVAGQEYQFDYRYPFGDFLSRERKEPGCSYFLDDSCFDQWRVKSGRKGGASAGDMFERAREELERPELRAIEGGTR